MDREELEQTVLCHIATALMEGEVPYFYDQPGWGPKEVGWLFERNPLEQLVARLQKMVCEVSWTSVTLVASHKDRFLLTVVGEAWYGELRGPAGMRQVIVRPYAFPIIIVDPAVYPALQ